MDSPKSSTHDHRRGVTHHLSHRTRYRLARSQRDASTLKQIHESVSKIPGVKQVEVNERTGSVLVHHEERPEILLLLSSALEDLGVDLLEGFMGEEFILLSSVPMAAKFLKSRLSGADSTISRLTHNYINLKTLLPLFFLGAGFYQASRNRLWWQQAPAYALFYYAFDSYIKLNGTALNFNTVKVPGNGHNKP